MPPQPHIRASIQGLKNDLAALLEGTGGSVQVNSVISVCLANARAILARRGGVNQLIRLHGLNLSDIAFDCISDLFARDDTGKYLALGSYFSAFSLSTLSDEEAYIHLQRLTYTKVRQGIFRLYREIDPQLGRILHNIKVVIHSLGQFMETERLGDSCIVPAIGDSGEHLPSMQAEELAARLAADSKGSEHIPELMGRLCKLLREQEEFSRVVPIVTVACAIRKFYWQKQIRQIEEHVTTIDDSEIDIREAIDSACASARAGGLHTYVTEGKVNKEVFDAYFEAIARLLYARLVEHDGDGSKLSEVFLNARPEISYEEYRRKHRNILEYQARIVDRKVKERLGGK